MGRASGDRNRLLGKPTTDGSYCHAVSVRQAHVSLATLRLLGEEVLPAL
jgi:hypothetical protein